MAQRTHRTLFVHTHLSGLWDTPLDRWIVALKQAMRGADVVTITEWTQTPLPASWFAKQGWTLITFDGPGRNECAIAVRNATFTVGERWCIPISKTPYALGSGKTRPRVHLIGAELTHVKTGEIVNAEVFHTPSAVEGKGGLLSGVRRVTALLECFSAIRAHRRTELKGEPTFVAADWNLDHKKAWVRALLSSRLKGLRSAWKAPLPKDGNMHFGRLIDGVRFTKSLVAVGHGSKVLGRVTPFDHRQISTVFGWRATSR